MVNNGSAGQEITASNNDSVSTTNANMVNVQTLERFFNESIDREMSNFVDTVEDMIQNAISTAIDNIITPRVELAVRSINVSSRRDAVSVTAISEREEHIGIFASLANISERNLTFRELNTSDETRGNIPYEAKEFLVPRTHFDRQSHTHHRFNLTGTMNLFRTKRFTLKNSLH